MADEKHTSKRSPEKTSSAGSQVGKGVDTQEIVQLLTGIFEEVRDLVQTRTRQPFEEGSLPDQAIEQFKAIKIALRVPTQLDPNIDPLKKWRLPPINPRANPSARAKEKE
ncbi:hypothetical protein Noc_2191 [Nitrosococcus oceani ATCC 19707]|uniref:Uncharacterized protein n=2 Tax=Nitrosococcus oceani TaxID=1229 RepID=Q3J945_NITOC|nr:hypothetical protein [Nitrosococcus oceani]ABA58651.1 hypothetical protein Noc_2191 [Nitrosococcus oceani ATCC 19707]KFI18951.1 hypothetical protein IB75_11675 [Nitrosococcus oceani C-27]GEM19771.1 hypothetical protein NONS58_11670 [Nitrosococcus oceani]